MNSLIRLPLVVRNSGSSPRCRCWCGCGGLVESVLTRKGKGRGPVTVAAALGGCQGKRAVERISVAAGGGRGCGGKRGWRRGDRAENRTDRGGRRHQLRAAGRDVLL